MFQNNAAEKPGGAPGQIKDGALTLKRLFMLFVESARLKVTEKITILLAYVAFVGVILALGLVCLVFISIGIGHLLATTVAPHLAYLIIAAFYLLLFGLAVAFKTPLFVNPVSRFMSRLIVEEPVEERESVIVGHDVARATAAERITHKH